MAPGDLAYDEGAFRVVGTDRVVSLEDVAAAAVANGAPADRGLEAAHRFVPVNSTFPNGCHIAEVEVDPKELYD